MLTFKPCIWRDGALTELPRPVDVVRVQDSWDFAQFKVPLASGDAIEGRSLNGVDISLEGRVGRQAGVLTADEGDMLAALEALRAALGVSAPEDEYELFLYHDSTSGTYRSFRECTTVRFEYDLSAPQLFSYSAVIHASDPAIYTDAPS
ncbi:MAG: hypothetical protein DWQ29_23300 [Planctomycetota bacterium]|nr:MAG: hypothetical protein DWQ29_23300 [Planctomycetota bacterium]